MTTTQLVPIFVNNLDRRPDRLAHVARQLDALDLSWQRISAHDADTTSDDELARILRPGRSLIPMGRGSGCNALSHFDIYRLLIAGTAPAALVLEDDVELSPAFAQLVHDLDWVPDGIDIVQLERTGDGASRLLVGPGLSRLDHEGRSVHRLHSRAAGSACYLITRSAAEAMLRTVPPLATPIDHALFSPNTSAVFAKIGVAVVLPAMARQRVDLFPSDIETDRRSMRRGTLARIRRLVLDLNRLPGQLLAMGRGAMWRKASFVRLVTPAIGSIGQARPRAPGSTMQDL